MQRRTVIGGLGAALSALLPLVGRAKAAVPQPIDANLVQVAKVRWNGPSCLAVELTDAEQQLRLNTQGGGNRPSIATVASDFTNGVIEATIGGELTGRGAPDDRGFVGLSFHIGADFQSHETVYLRLTNGRLNVPAPRVDRAIQCVADLPIRGSTSPLAHPLTRALRAGREIG